MPDNMEALTALYDQHKAQEEGPSILIRLDVVTAMAKTKDPAALPMLKQIVLKDNHWDVCEEADKLLLTFGEAAIPYMIQIIEEAKTWESWKMIIACDNLGKLKAIQGISSMLKLAEHGDFLVRIAALSALSEIAAVHPQQRDKILLAILQGLQDERGEVRQVAVDCCLRLIPHMADQHQAFKQRIKSLQSDENIIVRKKAQDVLDAHF